MRSMIKILVILTVSVLFASCGVVERVYFETLTPADTVIDLKIQDVDIVNRFIIENSNNPQRNLATWEIDSVVSFELVRGLYDELSQAERFRFKRVDTVYYHTISENPRIELLNVALNPTTLSGPVRDYATGLYRAVVRVEFQVQWALLDNNNVPVYERNFRDTVWLEGLKPNFSTLYDLVEFDKAITHIVDKTARKFASEISPTWKRTYRYLFISGHNDFVVAGQYVAAGKWDNAEKLWLYHSQSRNSTLAGRANHNLAVKAEREGKLLVALEYAKKAAEEYRFSQSREYVAILSARIRNVAVIESQMP